MYFWSTFVLASTRSPSTNEPMLWLGDAGFPPRRREVTFLKTESSALFSKDFACNRLRHQSLLHISETAVTQSPLSVEKCRDYSTLWSYALSGDGGGPLSQCQSIGLFVDCCGGNQPSCCL
jgi:hypothetical protein